MVKIEKFLITLNKPIPIYTTGEIVSGVVKICPKERMKINGISIVLNGWAKVHWVEYKARFGRIKYEAEENYLNKEVKLLDKSPGQDELYLEETEYALPFQFVLTQNLPCSFEHNYGRIRYNLNAIIDIPWAFSNKISRKSFTVINQYDLNLNPTLSRPYGASETKIKCCGPCKSEPLIVKFHLSKTGFVPGESIYFSSIIENKTNKEIKNLSAELVQIIKLRSINKIRKCTRLVAKKDYPHTIQGKSTETWNSVRLVIPPTVPTSNGLSKIIQVNYRVSLNFNDSAIPDLNTSVNIPIVIGTIPLIIENKKHNGLYDDSISVCSLPTYEQCVFEQEQVNLEDKMPNDVEFEAKGELINSDTREFKPLYPYFKEITKRATNP